MIRPGKSEKGEQKQQRRGARRGRVRGGKRRARGAGTSGGLQVGGNERRRTGIVRPWAMAKPHAAECIRDALGNDIGIMAERGTNEMTNGPTDWKRGPSGAPSKEGQGVIIQANKGRSYRDYRVPRAALLCPWPTPPPSVCP